MKRRFRLQSRHRKIGADPRAGGPCRKNQVLVDQPVVDGADGATRNAQLGRQIATGRQASPGPKHAVEDRPAQTRMNLFADRLRSSPVKAGKQVSGRLWINQAATSWACRPLTRIYIGGVMKSKTKHVEEKRGGASLYGASVEYGLHSLLWLLAEQPKRASSRDLA